MEVSRNNCRAVLRSFLLHVDWRKIDSSVNREPQGNWRWNSNSRDLVAWKLSFLFPPHHQSTLESLLAGYPQGKPTTCTLYPGKKVKAHMSQRPKWPRLIRVSLVWSIPRSINFCLRNNHTGEAWTPDRCSLLHIRSNKTYMSENPGREMKVTNIQFPPKKLNSKNTRDISLSPGMNGSGGFSWYFPRHMSISAKFIPQLWIATLTWWNFSKRKRFIKQNHLTTFSKIYFGNYLDKKMKF